MSSASAFFVDEDVAHVARRGDLVVGLVLVVVLLDLVVGDLHVGSHLRVDLLREELAPISCRTWSTVRPCDFRLLELGFLPLEVLLLDLLQPAVDLLVGDVDVRGPRPSGCTSPLDEVLDGLVLHRLVLRRAAFGNGRLFCSYAVFARLSSASNSLLVICSPSTTATAPSGTLVGSPPPHPARPSVSDASGDDEESGLSHSKSASGSLARVENSIDQAGRPGEFICSKRDFAVPACCRRRPRPGCGARAAQRSRAPSARRPRARRDRRGSPRRAARASASRPGSRRGSRPARAPGRSGPRSRRAARGARRPSRSAPAAGAGRS